MDENRDLPTQPDMGEKSKIDQPESDAAEEKVVEITPDFNISPIKEPGPKERVRITPIAAGQQPLTPLQEAIGKLNIPPVLKPQAPKTVPTAMPEPVTPSTQEPSSPAAPPATPTEETHTEAIDS